MLQDRCRGASPETLEMDERALSLLRLTLERLGDSPSARSATARPRTQRRQRELVHRVRAILALRFADPLRLSDIARAAGASPWHLARLFAIHTGTSMHRHRTRLRIHAALRRLADGERDLTTLALDLGFASHAHFSDVFRRECGVPPSRFRERIDRRPHGSCARS
jgi:AraC-like DNA-binding protein